eukprot:4763844-Alexandrium_andersonii.AAC.1
MSPVSEGLAAVHYEAMPRAYGWWHGPSSLLVLCRVDWRGGGPRSFRRTAGRPSWSGLSGSTR